MPGPRGGARQQGRATMPEGGWAIARRLLRFVLSHYKVSLAVVAVCIVVTSVTTLTSSLFTRTLIDDYILPLTRTASPDFTPLAATLMKLGAVLLVGAITSYVHSRLMINVGQGSLRRLRTDLFSHMQELPVGYFDRHSHGEIMSVYTNDVDTLRQMIGQSLPNVFSSAITLVVTTASMLVLSWQLTLLTAAMTVVMIVTTRKLGARSAAHFKEQQASLAALNGFVEEMLTGQKVVKTFCHEREAIEQFHRLNEQLRASAASANKIANIVMPVNGNISNLIYVLCATVGAALALTDGLSVLTIGTLVSFLTLIKNFTQPISQMSQQVNSVVMAVAGAGRVFDMLDAEPERDDEAHVTLVRDADDALAWRSVDADGRQKLTPQRGEVDFQNVVFGYVPEKQVLHDINLDTEAGQKVALVGGTGAGKTTIINLINRFYDIDRGTVLYDGINIVEINRADLRRSLGMVLQETHLFGGTVMENIRYGRLDATDEECRAAARLVNADDFIRRLPNGYDTVLAADGTNLSQGERQLIAIARTAIANPPALILDEATSNIDTRTERLVQQGMDSLMAGRSTFVIAHRLSTVRNADKIVVMDHGRIIEQGSHRQLMEARGPYYRLYTGNAID